MKVFHRRPPVPVTPERARFAAWLLAQFAGGKSLADLPFSEVERICAKAGSIFLGAAHARPECLGDPADETAADRSAAAVLMKRTADGFKTSLADRNNAVIAWPWDHLGTSIAWEATRAEDTSEAALAAAFSRVAASYALRHRDQLESVLDLWKQVAGALRPDAAEPDLRKMGLEMLIAYEALSATSVS